MSFNSLILGILLLFSLESCVQDSDVLVCSVASLDTLKEKEVQKIAQYLSDHDFQKSEFYPDFRHILEELKIDAKKNIYIYVDKTSANSNAYFLNHKESKFIVLTEDLVNQLKVPTLQNRPLITYFILFHELGHYLNNHDKSSLENEAIADEFAGKCLYSFFSGIGDIKNIAPYLAINSTETHPNREVRLKNIERGFNLEQLDKAVEVKPINTKAIEFESLYPMVEISPNSFLMGSGNGMKDPDANDMERPQTKVPVKIFEIGKFEVTQKLWTKYMGPENNPSKNKGCDECPVEFVSMSDIAKFINTVNSATKQRYRIPLESEWEYVARYKMNEKEIIDFHKSDLADHSWNIKNSLEKTNVVGKKQHNANIEVYDMIGNVNEWCDDKFVKYGNSDGPESSYFVIRGGSVYNIRRDPRWAIGYRIRDRNKQKYEDKFEGTGLRLVRDKIN